MKIAFLMQCHKNSIQINRLIDKLKHSEVDVYIHIDSKSQRLREEIKRNENVHLLPNEKCVDVQWGTFSQVTATLNLIEFARTNGGVQLLLDNKWTGLFIKAYQQNSRNFGKKSRI